jgi:hypothetical protein
VADSAGAVSNVATVKVNVVRTLVAN